MKKIVYGAITSASCFLFSTLYASAQSTIDLEARLNQSNICATGWRGVGFRPSLTLFATALARSSPVRAWINSRQNSAS
jgi:hypothetical protein